MTIRGVFSEKVDTEDKVDNTDLFVCYLDGDNKRRAPSLVGNNKR